MSELSYSEFKDKLYSSTTKNFIDKLLYNYAKNYYEYGKNKKVKNDKRCLKLFIDMMEAYNELPEPAINLSAYREPKEVIVNYSVQVDYEKVFDSLREYIDIYDNEIWTYLLTPEAIIRHMAHFVDNSDDSMLLFNCSTSSGIQNVFWMKDKELVDKYKSEIHDYFIEKVQPSTYKYLNAAYNIYTQLLEIKDEIKIGEHNNDKCIRSEYDLIVLSLLLAAYKYKDFNLNDLYDDNKLIVDYLSQKGLDYNTLIDTLRIDIDLNTYRLEFVDRDVNISYYYKYVISSWIEKDTLPPKLVCDLLTRDYKDSKILRELFYKLSINKDAFNSLKYNIQDTLSHNKNIDDYMKNISTSTYDFIVYLVNLYTYLETQYNQKLLSNNIERKDLITLALLIASFDYSACGTLGIYLTNMKVTKNDVLSYAGITQYYVSKDFNYGKYNLYKFNNIIDMNDSNLYPGKIMDKAMNNNNTKSDLIQNIFYKVTGTSLEDNFKDKAEKYFVDKQKIKNNELETKYLSNLSVDVFRYLKLLSNNFNYIKVANTNIGDKASLAIILSAIQQDSNFKLYLQRKGAKLDNILKDLGIDIYINYRDIDITVIDAFFKDYIYDREEKDITIYSILENGFNNDKTFLLKKILFNYGINIDDYKNISTDIIPFNEEVNREKEMLQENHIADCMYRACTELTKPLFDNSLKVLDYLMNHENETPIKLSIDEMKILSLLIGLFIIKDGNAEYFEQNGITLDLLLKTLKIPKSFLDGISNEVTHTKLIAKYDDDFDTFNKNIDLPRVIVYILSSESLIKRIISTVDYHVLKDDVLNQKKKTIAPEEGIKMLKSAKTPSLDSSSLLTLTSFGDTMSEHSKIISDSLKELMMKDSVIDNQQDMNTIFESFKPKKKGFLKIFSSRKSKYTLNSDNLGSVSSKIVDNRDTLRKELNTFDYIRQYIEIYLSKLDEHIKELKKYRNEIVERMNNSDSEGIEEYTDSLNYQTILNVIDNKIETFTINITLMKQELLKVHRLIESHNRAINALSTAANTIIPLIGHEQLNLIGTRTEMETNAITSELILLLKNVVTYNELAAKDNLERLKLSKVEDEEIKCLTISLDNCFDDSNKKVL